MGNKWFKLSLVVHVGIAILLLAKNIYLGLTYLTINVLVNGFTIRRNIRNKRIEESDKKYFNQLKNKS